MNYYERYMGDYQRDTGHLSLAEHGAYNVLLDTYYSTEQPLAADMDRLFRICRAMSRAEQDAVRAVVDEFFPLADDGLRHNVRADSEIARARPKMEAARTNGMRGGRPRKNPTETQQKPSGFLDRNPVGSEQKPNGNPTETQQEPSTKAPQPHTPTPKEKPPKPPGAVAPGFGEFWALWPRKTAKAAAEKAWAKLAPDELLRARISRAVREHALSEDWRKEGGRFIPHAATWLNGRRWEDELPMASSGEPKPWAGAV